MLQRPAGRLTGWLAENTQTESERASERTRVYVIRARAAHQLIAEQSHSTKSTVMHTVQLFRSFSVALVPLRCCYRRSLFIMFSLGIQRN